MSCGILEDLLRAEGLETKGRFATLGSLIIDQFELADRNNFQAIEAIGGGGMYAMIGARMFLPPSHLGLVVDRGTDFPAAFKEQLSVLGEGAYSRERDEPTSRALNLYSGGKIGEGHQSFRYLTPPIKITLSDLARAPSPFAGKPPEWVHVVVRHPRAKEIIQERDAIRAGEVDGVDEKWRPKLIWEPLDVQGGEKLSVDEWCEIIMNFDVISPNLLELQYILGIEGADHNDQKTATEYAASRLQSLLEGLGKGPPIVLVRAGRLGCYSISPSWMGWSPAYWQDEDQDMIIDPTGGGNGFLGGFAAGMIIAGDDARIASIFGSAAASFMIQQRGMPNFRRNAKETWNDDNPWDRVRVVEARMDNVQ